MTADTANGTGIHLSPRQLDVARLVARGYDTTQIAEELQISREATKMHLQRIAEKIDRESLLTALRLVRFWAVQQDWLRAS